MSNLLHLFTGSVFLLQTILTKKVHNYTRRIDISMSRLVIPVRKRARPIMIQIIDEPMRDKSQLSGILSKLIFLHMSIMSRTRYVLRPKPISTTPLLNVMRNCR